MLARLGRRKFLIRHHASRYFDSILLRANSTPKRWLVQSSQIPQLQSSEPWRRQPTTSVAKASLRSLATATDFHSDSTDPIPFLSIAPILPQNSDPTTLPLSDLPYWGSFKPLVIPDQSSRPSRAPLVANGIGGHTAELFQNLHATLGVGRYERAEAILRRLQSLYVPSAPELVEAHKIYIRGMVNALSIGTPSASLKKVQRWFEVEVRQAGIELDSSMVALMCRACFVALEGPARVRTIRRYLHVAEEFGILEDTMASEEFLQVEWRELLQIRDDLFATPTDEEMLQLPDVGDDIIDARILRAQQIKSLPAVRSVPQKGLGLQTLQKSLYSLSRADQVPYPHDMQGTREEKDYEWNLRRQCRLEEDVCDAALEQWRAEYAQMLKMGINPGLKSKPMAALLFEWHNALKKEIDNEVDEIKKALNKWDGSKRCTPSSDDQAAVTQQRLYYGPYLEGINTEKIAAHTLMATMDALVHDGGLLAMTEGIYIRKLALTIGTLLEAESNVSNQQTSKRFKSLRKRLVQHRRRIMQKISKTTVVDQPVSDLSASAKTKMAGNKRLSAVQDVEFEWPETVKVQVGALLLAKLIDVARIQRFDPVDDDSGTQSSEPAFRHGKVLKKARRMGVIIPHEALLTKMRQEPLASVIAAKLPMLVPPAPWRDFKAGGYLKHATPFIRVKGNDETQTLYAKAAADKGDLEQVFAGLNVLGRTAWRINRNVLEVMLNAWNSGEAIAAIPPENPELTYPKEPDSSADSRTKFRWRRACQDIDNEKSGYHSQRCFFNLQLELARAYSNDTFYYPHNIDFRGRAYPVPPYLNHMGADNARGLLQFAVGKELGPTGIQWLKVHLANVFGYDKASLKEREAFASDHMEDVFDSAANPLSGRRWWLKAEDPWQCLAACFELKAALESPDPSKFVSHLAVHQDGSCNGLQHYAALGGDAFGASQVNLEPGDRPADVYSGVADLVKAEIARDAANGDAMAKALEGRITRKVVKQTVMTNVYGVTFIGARDQVLRQLDDIMRSGTECEFSNFVLAGYIARKIFNALATMFEGAQAIQKWLGECADRVSTAISREQIAKIRTAAQVKTAVHDGGAKSSAMSKSKETSERRKKEDTDPVFRSTVIWTTPLKLPVVQPYRGRKYKDIKTALQLISIANPSSSQAVVKRKQLQAFPPNFIHSLDATHMLLSALKSDEIGLTFAAVHDSFWTHAADVPVMNRVLRDAFIRMHTEDVMGRLAAEFNARYRGSMYLASVNVRSAVGKEIGKLRRKMNQPSQIAGRLGPAGAKKARARSKLVQELLTECERQEMLNSDDPEVRRKGEEMVTPASLLLSAKPEDLALPEKLGAFALGAIPADAELEQSPLTSAEDLEGEHDEADEVVDPDAEEEVSLSNPTQKTARKAEKKIRVWLPLTIPDLPKKGDWDISRLRDSTYFFS